ncbi:MAG: hypothetical protein CMA19_06620 [Euryarchaeota archaeon]|nr:hypothetical protein [Euryarchaeota archaeon]|tara:strand:+ start:1976 stop:4261 length:2286 start_codon:yes stop_codon:yes gene_type:complete
MVTMVHGTRIRSTYQRRILDWLADGGGTVTEVSQALALRVPHTSAALKKLRDSGYVVRDDQNLRGSRYRLTSQGVARLESDGLARMGELVRWPPPPGAAGIVLAREGSMLLLGYASKTAGPLLGLPERPMNEESGVVEYSSGNGGESGTWRWAVQRGEGPVWWELDSKRRAQAPNEPSPMTLTAWMERPKVMGIVRARILDESKPWPLGVGSWFSALPDGLWPELPPALRDGDLIIGRAGNSGPQVRPRGGVHARLGRRVDRSQIIRTTSANAFTIADGDLLSKDQTPLPKELLRHWLKLIHPRLGQDSIEERYNRLLSDITSFSSNALTRRVLNDFPGRKWVDVCGDFIDTRSVSQRGGEAIVRYALAEVQKSIVLDWRWPMKEDLLSQFTSDSRCRVVICESADLGLPFILTSVEGNGKFNLEMPRRLLLPIRVDRDISAPNNWIPPASPSELIRGEQTQVNDATSELEAIWQSTQLAVGDEQWADRHENNYPLASWIATPDSYHASRWRRIGGMLDPIWAELADLDMFDNNSLCEMALVNDDALSKLVKRFRSNPLQMLSADTSHPAIATAILLSREWMEQEIDVASAWLSQPLRLGEVLRKNWNNNDVEILATACPQHLLLLQNTQFSRDEILAIMEDVHYSLWLENSSSWLPTCLASSIGRTALSMIDLPWPAILYQQGLTSEDLVLVHHMPDGVGKDALMDVLEGISAAEEGRNPPCGRTHPLAGWLFQKQVPSLSAASDFNPDVHLALHRRLQQ